MTKKTPAKKTKPKSETPSEFALFVKNFRTMNHLSAKDLAEKIGRDKLAVINVENDKFDIPLTFFRLLAPHLTAGQREYVEMMFQAHIVKLLRTPIIRGQDEPN